MAKIIFFFRANESLSADPSSNGLVDRGLEPFLYLTADCVTHRNGSDENVRGHVPCGFLFGGRARKHMDVNLFYGNILFFGERLSW